MSIIQEAENHTRHVIFETGMPGGIFLAAKVDNKWQLVFDGNDAITCTLSQYGFPQEMLSDCAN